MFRTAGSDDFLESLAGQAGRDWCPAQAKLSRTGGSEAPWSMALCIATEPAMASVAHDVIMPVSVNLQVIVMDNY
ncbi:uncharacterized protein GLRG_10451 [Colletotrichum graminicola M1.001]|uniref:Uncharacterized protein n=1 Tax=Colletotrichum graminicola (strain M1.001 / M2 / FGSC 10212) TaxID=645133 RepID=E3QWR9_COLGM|nr:uncharacterized protein GLRG_10451 [Colletotrichum graminicola M1.001]EFQ35307.1 hypothetical protein GLRG_10451 [Colletotrichum graminicola M1.001]